MSKNRKYSAKIEQQDSTWRAQILRQVTSVKTVVSKEQAGFNSQSDAMAWAEQQLEVFSTTLSDSNKRHGEQRKANSQERVQRSARRSEKTLLIKEEANKNNVSEQE